MGAFIAYLHLEHGIRHFFVLAPNLTIYNKLIADFTPEHAQIRVSGHRRICRRRRRPSSRRTTTSTSADGATRSTALDDVQINIFNISKINVRSRGRARKIRRLSEFLGRVLLRLPRWAR